MPAITEFKVGQRVKFKHRGKVARLEGFAGKIVTGTVTGLENADLGLVSVMCDHRLLPDSPFKNMGTAVDVADLKFA